MSFVTAMPELVTAAAADLAGIGSTIEGANAAAAGPTTNLLAAAEDEVSTAIAALFGTHAREFQALSAQAAAFHNQFTQALSTGAGSYSLTEAANSSPLRTLLDDFQSLLKVVNTPTEELLGRPLIGPGTNGAPGTGASRWARRSADWQWRQRRVGRHRGRPAVPAGQPGCSATVVPAGPAGRRRPAAPPPAGPAEAAGC